MSETNSTPETAAKPAKVNRTVYASRAEAEANKPAQQGKLVLRLRPVSHNGTPLGYTWTADAFTAVYNAALHIGVKAGEPADDKAPPTPEETLSKVDSLEDLEKLQKLLAARKKALKAAQTPESPPAEQAENTQAA